MLCLFVINLYGLIIICKCSSLRCSLIDRDKQGWWAYPAPTEINSVNPHCEDDAIATRTNRGNFIHIYGYFGVTIIIISRAPESVVVDGDEDGHGSSISASVHSLYSVCSWKRRFTVCSRVLCIILTKALLRVVHSLSSRNERTIEPKHPPWEVLAHQPRVFLNQFELYRPQRENSINLLQIPREY